MKALRLFSVLLLIFAFLGCEKNPPTGFSPTNFDVSVPWQHVNGPKGGGISSVVISGNTTLAGGYGGLFISTDHGQSWTAPSSPDPPNSSNITGFVVYGDSLFALVWNGLYLSTDNGSSWTGCGYIPGELHALAATDSGLFAGTNNGIYLLPKSNNAQWLPTSFRNFYVTALAARGNALFGGTDSYGFFRSTDGGATWTIANSGLSSTSIYSLAVVGSNLLAGTNSGIFSSQDDGTHWHQIAGVYVRCFVVEGGQVLAGTSGGIVQSSDGGATWTGTGLADKSIATLAASGTYWIAGTDDGPYVSMDNGSTWTLSNAGMSNATIRDIIASGPNLLASVNEYGVLLSTNHGDDWTKTDLPPGYAAYLTQCGGYDFVTIADDIYRSSNHGANWHRISSMPDNYYVSSMAGSGSRLYAGTYGGTFVSNDFGMSWTKLQPRFKNSSIYILAADDNVVFAGGYDGVYRSTDQGGTWTEMVFKISYSQFGSIAICRATTYLSVWGADGSGNYYSIDDGATWAPLRSDALQNYVFDEIVPVKSDVFVSTYSDVFVSHDDGASWKSVGFRYSTVSCMASDGTYLYVGTSNSGLFRHPL